jgi:hypothetical protein
MDQTGIEVIAMFAEPIANHTLDQVCDIARGAIIGSLHNELVQLSRNPFVGCLVCLDVGLAIWRQRQQFHHFFFVGGVSSKTCPKLAGNAGQCRMAAVLFDGIACTTSDVRLMLGFGTEKRQPFESAFEQFMLLIYLSMASRRNHRSGTSKI